MSHHIFVIAEHLKGKLTDTTFEALGAARTLADAMGGQVVGLLLGHEVDGMAEQMGAADRVLVVDDPALAHFVPEAHLAALEPLLREHQPRLTLFLNTAMGMDLAAALSARLDWPLVAYCNGLRVEDGAVVTTSQIYGGKVLAECALADGPGLVSVLAGAFPADAGRAGDPPVVETVTPAALGEGRIRFGQLIEPEAGDVDITRAEIIVAIGRGIQSEDNIEVAEELAEALDGVVAASRPIVDAGWLPRTRQVGKSGLTVKPKLYLALGISGAPEHVEGMKDAELIIAVNTDPNAPIFDVAHYGVVADLFDVADALLEALEA
ncbi:MAG: electron transfer flavoprotein subunit alpha/FixB family protein [Chloroflexi bacterium]|nr:MAG: electron transfer flavoprotein subunit alpha/FixB family protein [Chloroflexota bacterium]